ncbi:MAG: hypothetical protein EXS31_19070 [Pedosphaera sp.]|nr:hypothetical protein [Pedosphaera sp.]
MIHAAAITFEVSESVGTRSFNLTSAPIEAVYGPLKTTVTLLKSDETICIVASHLVTHTHQIYRAIQRTVRQAIGLAENRVVVFSSHNHCSVQLTEEPAKAFHGEGVRVGTPKLTKPGKQFFEGLAIALRQLPGQLQPVTVSWAVGREGRISYNRKGRRADGTTYLMREEDRLKLGRDFRGDIDEEAPVICLTDRHGQPVTFLTQFNAHPATAFHPEHPLIHGEYPQVACDVLAAHYRRDNRPVPISFLQGCAGEINSKGLLSGDVARAERFGRMLGQSYIAACRKLRPSETDRLALRRTVARVPLRALPTLQVLLQEKQELDHFIRRARRGDDDTRSCVGLNFPERLSPAYRATLVKPPQQWNAWAIRMHQSGRQQQLPEFIEMELCIIRLGDVGIVGMPCEPFLSISRQIARGSPSPLTIACGYTNVSYGYVPDGANVGDREYMSAFHRYTRRPPFRKPAGDTLAHAAIRELKHLFC